MAWSPDPASPATGFSGDPPPSSPQTGDKEPDFTNHVIDPSLEAQDPDWKLSVVHANYHTDGGHTDSTYVRLSWSIIAFPQDGRFGQQINFPAGDIAVGWSVSWWMRQAQLTGNQTEKALMRITLWPGLFNPGGSGNFGTPPDGTFIEIPVEDISEKWSYHTFGPVFPGRLDNTIGIQGTLRDSPVTPAFASMVDFDDFSVQRNIWDEDATNPSTHTPDPV